MTVIRKLINSAIIVGRNVEHYNQAKSSLYSGEY